MMTYTYEWYQWLLFFYFYCFVGWCFESAYVSLAKRRFVNRGFLHAPLLQIYGSGAIVILFASIPVKDHWWLVFIVGALAATILEYFTGVLMEALFKVRYWDYSNQKFNFQGHICLSSTLAWGGLSVLLLYVIHRPVAYVMTQVIPRLPQIIGAVLISVGFAADFVISFRDAWGLRRILEKMTQLKAEISELQERILETTEEKLALIRSESSQWLENRREESSQWLESRREEAAKRRVNLREEYVQRLENIKQESFAWLYGDKDERSEHILALHRYLDDHLERLKARESETDQEKRGLMIRKIEKLQASYKSLKARSGVKRASILKRNPGAVSKKFEAAMAEYKLRVLERKKDREDQ